MAFLKSAKFSLKNEDDRDGGGANQKGYFSYG
jgi:hypothetical protein